MTAHDFVYSWKRTCRPSSAADYAYQLYGIQGAQAYNSCEPKKQTATRSRQGRRRGARRPHAPGDADSAQPWFVQQAAHHSFLAVNKQGGRELGRQVDRAEPHRHRRPVQAGRAGGTTPRSTWSSGTAGATPTSVALDARQRQDHHRRHDRRAVVRGRRGRRRHDRPPAGRHAAAEAAGRRTRSTRRSAPTTTASTSRTSPT